VSDMIDLFLSVGALILLGAAVAVLLRGQRLDQARIGVAVAVIVLAAGTFAVALYRSQTGDSRPGTGDGPAAGGASAAGGEPGASGPVESATQRLGTAVIRVRVPMGSGDTLPQGTLDLDPPRPGVDAYHGDVSLLCSTPGRSEDEQSCGGADRRVWSAEPLGKRAVLGAASGDPFADPNACAEANGVRYGDRYLQLTAGRAYCLRTAGRSGQVVALRVPVFPAEQPLPVKIEVETAVLDSPLAGEFASSRPK
jgi:hypothetical protein